MCTGMGSGADLTPPEEKLAKTIKDDLGVEISPQALRMLIRMRWGHILALAHIIHRAGSETTG